MYRTSRDAEWLASAAEARAALAWLRARGYLCDAGAERGCTDCGRRLTLDSEIAVSVCRECQDAFLRVLAWDNTTEPRTEG